jgi:hypothetical protein
MGALPCSNRGQKLGRIMLATIIGALLPTVATLLLGFLAG